MKIKNGLIIKIIISISVVLLLCVVLNISLEYSPSNERSHTIGKAVSDFKMIESAYLVLESGFLESSFDKNFLKKKQENLNAELTKMPGLEVSPRYLSPDDKFLDPWGTPYHIRIDFDTESSFDKKGLVKNKGEIILEGKKIKKRIIIWSSGPNTINEFGKGDDVKSW